MSWWEGGGETRLLIAPDPGAVENGISHLLLLRHPKSGNATCYIFTNGMLQELHWFKQSYGSWFLGDYVCEDGCLYMATPVDPVFILLPIFEEARMKKGDDPGKFRQLDEIIFINGYPGYQHLLSVAENCMQVVCEVKEIGSSKFFRLDDLKVLAWLYHKVCQLKKTLPALDLRHAAQDEKDTLADAVSILGEYLKDEPWLNLLRNRLKLDPVDATKNRSDIGVFPHEMESNMGPSNLLQEKGMNDKKITRAGRQAKKVKLETESHNIREMFCRASRRRK
ncbi:RNase_H2-Ydr279 domain-containing protein [Cephalotus follicularis]|uniref:Ribonuclease H2 subunit B n=1 Tax=Cephalotus follicularis TaxID=3775 RepID=A0A1Q3BW54_CEPFO|nr:RNase_H2-Ydr279 domain-containing protein [Cephalotus follicularis]